MEMIFILVIFSCKKYTKSTSLYVCDTIYYISLGDFIITIFKTNIHPKNLKILTLTVMAMGLVIPNPVISLYYQMVDFIRHIHQEHTNDMIVITAVAVVIL